MMMHRPIRETMNAAHAIATWAVIYEINHRLTITAVELSSFCTTT